MFVCNNSITAVQGWENLVREFMCVFVLEGKCIFYRILDPCVKKVFWIYLAVQFGNKSFS